jgi:transposase-like protein
MGKQRRKFDTGFKQQIVGEVESGVLSVSAASRKYQISGSVIDKVVLKHRRQFVRSFWNVRTASSRRSSRNCTWKTAS